MTVPTGYDPHDYPPFAVTADLNIFTVRDGALHILLVERGGEPFKGHWALPGGFCQVDESVEVAALRELEEETGIAPGTVHVEQVCTYSAPDRDPRMRVVSVSFAALAAGLPDPVAGDDAANARYWRVSEVLDEGFSLAFDHEKIIRDALERVRSKLEYTTLATNFVKSPFTLAELRAVYTAVWGVEPDLPNFRRKVLSVDGFVEPVRKDSSRGAGPAPMLYTAGPATTFSPPFIR